MEKGEILETLKIKKPFSYMKMLQTVSHCLIVLLVVVMVIAFDMLPKAVAGWLYAVAVLAVAVLFFVRALTRYSAGYFNEIAKREAFKDSAIMAVEDGLIKSETKIQYPLKLSVDDVKSGDKAEDKKIRFLTKSYVAWKTLKVRVHTSDNSQKWDVVLDQKGNIKVKAID